MRVAGIGFRSAAPLAALQDALTRAGGGPLDALATETAKADTPQAKALAKVLNLPLLPVLSAELARQTTQTLSPRMEARYGTGSLAEAAALAAAGPGARLLAPRAVSACGQATAAIAEGPDP